MISTTITRKRNLHRDVSVHLSLRKGQWGPCPTRRCSRSDAATAPTWWSTAPRRPHRRVGCRQAGRRWPKTCTTAAVGSLWESDSSALGTWWSLAMVWTEIVGVTLHGRTQVLVYNTEPCNRKSYRGIPAERKHKTIETKEWRMLQKEWLRTSLQRIIPRFNYLIWTIWARIGCSPSTHSTRLMTNRMENTMPGYKNAVINVFFFHWMPRNILYVMEE